MISPQIAKKRKKKYTSVIHWNMHIGEQYSFGLLRKQKGRDQHYLNKREVTYTLSIVLKTPRRRAIKI